MLGLRVSYTDILIVYCYKLNFPLFGDRYLFFFLKATIVPYEVSFLIIVIVLPFRSLVPRFFVQSLLELISVNRSYIYKAGVRSLRRIAVSSRLLVLSIVSRALAVILIIIVAEFSSFVLARFSLSVNLSLIVEVLVIDSGY